MNKNLENLERQVEQSWSSLGLDLSVEPAQAVVERVRSAMRNELNESWLAGQTHPEPDEVLLGKVGDAMRRELVRMGAKRARVVRLRRWLAGVGGAAAAVLLVIGLARLSVPTHVGDGSAVLSADEQAIERFVQAADKVWSADPLTSEIREDLDAIEESVTQWPLNSEGETESIYDFNSRIDAPDASGVRVGLSHAGRLQAGAMG